MKKLPLLAIVLLTGCAPFSGFSATSGIAAVSAKSYQADKLTEDGERMLIWKIERHLEENAQ